MVIRDLLKAWKEVRQKRRAAKESLKLLESLYKCIGERKQQIFECFNILSTIYSYLPKDDRKTLDLLNISESAGWYSFYKKLYEDIEYNREVAYGYWNKGDYERVVELCGSVISDTDRKIDEYTQKDDLA